MIVGIDARAAAEVQAGRGRYVRELLSALAALEDDGTRYRLYAREAWGELPGDRFAWLLRGLPDPVWHAWAAGAASRSCGAFLSTNSYLTAWLTRIPTAVVVYDLVPWVDPANAQARAARIERATIGGAVLAEIAARGLDGAVRAPGFVAAEEVEAGMRSALCLLAPSEREGYGMVVVEASARGTPTVLAAGPDNAAVELVEEGVNGFVARSASPEDLAGAIVRVHEAGFALRESTAAWYRANARELSLESSLETVVASYEAR